MSHSLLNERALITHHELAPVAGKNKGKHNAKLRVRCIPGTDGFISLFGEWWEVLNKTSFQSVATTEHLALPRLGSTIGHSIFIASTTYQSNSECSSDVFEGVTWCLTMTQYVKQQVTERRITGMIMQCRFDVVHGGEGVFCPRSRFPNSQW